MRSSPWTLSLLSLACIVAGCSQTGAFKSGGVSDMKTVASVGDRPLPIVAGEPGASVRAETDDLDRPAPKGSRISGRVYDERGKPAPDVKVRLAVGGTAGGKSVIATTDRSGAFTLHGLHSGSSYTLIAEYEDEDGVMSGRAQVKAPQTDVRIALQPRDGSANQGHASIRPARPRVGAISNIDPIDDENSDELGGGSDRRINAEDLEPPAAEAAALLPANTARARRAPSDLSQPPVRAGWNVRQPGSKNGANASSESRLRDDGALTGGRPRSVDQAPAEADDDGPNPLPPAIDSGSASRTARPRALVEENLVRTAQAAPDSSSGPRGRATRANLNPDDAKAGDLADRQAVTPTLPSPMDGEGVAEQTRQPIPAQLLLADPGGPTGSAQTSRRPTWRELSIKQTDVPLDESLTRASGDAARGGDQGAITLTSKSPQAKSGLARLLTGSQPLLDEAVKQSSCKIDTNDRRLIDFKLPDLAGKMVSLHDIDADLILLDFWGSWCQPCRKSIPHLLELQTKLAGKRVQVVGIACEKAAAARDRQASAAKAVQELRITYPVLLSSRDGSCPLQEALQIQFYPTMVLLSRDGKLLAREQGATDVTLPRMDRAIASALRRQGERADD